MNPMCRDFYADLLEICPRLEKYFFYAGSGFGVWFSFGAEGSALHCQGAFAFCRNNTHRAIA